PNEIIDWLRRRFANRETTLTFDDFISALFAVDGGEDQGDPLSSIGYIVYAAGALKAMDRVEQAEGFAFMDDLTGLVWGKSLEEVGLRMEKMMRETDGVLEWAELHNCSFGLDKFKVV
ncbi:hypothetical protein K435DRAFT_596268, partial [Dendrothele bispora CBS 962.96]